VWADAAWETAVALADSSPILEVTKFSREEIHDWGFGWRVSLGV
jgi:hypothetical protein